MKSKKALTSKEELFCLYFLNSRNLRLSAAKAGYSGNCEKAALKLLCKKHIKERLKELEKQRSLKLCEITEGYRKLAFGSVCDAVRIALSQEVPSNEELEALDLTLVSDIKIPKSGGIEIKFFDRLKALDRLCEISSIEKSETGSDFLQALERSARALDSDGEESE